MIESVAVKNFQSLYDITIPLTDFTVLTGPSSTGKSAFIRAIRLLMENQRGTSFISHGEDTARVHAVFSNGDDVSIERGKRNHYALMIDGEIETYTKLGGEVPEDVQNFLGIDTDISIAGQFDPPFLLTASGAEVARTLGSLTNVDVVMAAAREANRQKLQASSSLRVVQEALAAAQSGLDALGDVDARAAAVAAAEAMYSATAAAEQQHGRLVEMLGAIKESAAALKQIVIPEIPDAEELFEQARAAAVAADSSSSLLQRIQEIEIPEVQQAPDLDDEIAAVRTAFLQWKDASRHLEEIGQQHAIFLEARAAAVEASSEAEQLEQQRVEMLQEMGVCPLCGSDTSHLGH